MLCKLKKEVSFDNFVYIKFPFVMIDYNGLKQLQLYHYELNQNMSKNKFRQGSQNVGIFYGINTKKI